MQLARRFRKLSTLASRARRMTLKSDERLGAVDMLVLAICFSHPSGWRRGVVATNDQTAD